MTEQEEKITEMLRCLRRLNEPVYAFRDASGEWRYANAWPAETSVSAAFIGPTPMKQLGDPSFCRDHGLHYPLYAGSMAHGIASAELVEAMGRSGMAGFYGAAGETPDRVEAALVSLRGRMGGGAFGFNLINSPNAPDWEKAVADIYIRHGLRLVEASAYVALSPALVKYRVKGVHRGPDGAVTAPNRVIAKVSRAEVAERFFAPPPEKLLRRLVEAGEITPEEAALAAEMPMAADVTAEADSGGHTDHRAAFAMLPGLLALRDAARARHGYRAPLRVGLAGGIATPHAVAAAFAMGAAYVATGSVNQACVESGTSDAVRALLANASQTDVARAPAADMFEMGVTVQVLKKGTRFAERACRLHDLYRRCEGLDDIPAEDRQRLEETVFRMPLDQVWAQTRDFFAVRDPRQVEKAEADTKHKMALVFRWYLGSSSHWANTGDPERGEDYQVWCGPGMGAFNDWTRGTFMGAPAGRSAPLAAANMLFHGAVLLRAAALRAQGAPVDMTNDRVAPLGREELDNCLSGKGSD